MSRFLDHASELLEAAAAVADEAHESVTILIHPQGQIHIVQTADRAPLAAPYGHGSAYQISRGNGRVRVEGRQGASRCLLEQEVTVRKPSAARLLGVFHDLPVYPVAGTLAA